MNIGRGYVYNLKFHVVICVKYRKKLLNNVYEKFLLNYFTEQSKRFDVKILEFNTDKDHVHLLIETKPNFNIISYIKALKGGSARAIIKQYPEIRKELYGGAFWNPSYFISTVSDTLESDIRKYIQNQKKSGKRY